MPTLIKSQDDGNVYEATDLVPVTLDEIDARIAHANNHVAELQKLRDEFIALDADTSVIPPIDAPAAPAAPADPLAPAAPVDQPVVDPAPVADAPVVDPGTPVAPIVDPTELAPVDAPVAANGDAGQAPAIPAVDAPGADAAALNNGQVDPAAASNPTPADPTTDPTVAIDSTASDAPVVPVQPVINA